MTDVRLGRPHTPLNNHARAGGGEPQGESQLSDDRHPADALSSAELALAEAQHRAANHLQLLVSLMDLYARRATTQEARDVLADLRRTAALRLLYRARPHGMARSIDVDAYINEQALGWRSFCDPRGIRLELEVARVMLPVDQVATLGLIADELVVNSIKHAFPEGRSGVIRVALSVDAERVMLTVSDDGTGPSEQARSGGLGRDLLIAMAAQLEGKLVFSTDGGTAATLIFPFSTWAAAASAKPSPR